MLQEVWELQPLPLGIWELCTSPSPQLLPGLGTGEGAAQTLLSVTKESYKPSAEHKDGILNCYS